MTSADLHNTINVIVIAFGIVMHISASLILKNIIVPDVGKIYLVFVSAIAIVC